MNFLRALLVWLIALNLSQASTLFTDNFNSYSDGTLPTGTAWTSVTDNGTTQLTRIATDTANLFQQGTANKALYLNFTVGGSTVASITDVSTGTTTGQVSFNFYDPKDTGAAGSGYFFRIGTGNANSVTNFAVGLKEGSLYIATGSSIAPAATAFATYSTDTLNSLSIVFNSSTSLLTYGDNITVASGKMDIWLNGVLVGDDLDYAGNVALGTSLDNVNITTKGSTFSNSLYIDDLTFTNTIAIPEPGSITCVLIGLTLCGYHRRLKHIE